MGFEVEWLDARRPYDEAALDHHAIGAIQAWASRLPPGYVPIVVDLGSGTGVALARARRWLAPRPIIAYAVDRDVGLLDQARAGGCTSSVARVVGDLLSPLYGLGGPADGTVDLVLGHAV